VPLALWAALTGSVRRLYLWIWRYWKASWDWQPPSRSSLDRRSSTVGAGLWVLSYRSSGSRVSLWWPWLTFSKRARCFRRSGGDNLAALATTSIWELRSLASRWCSQGSCISTLSERHEW